MPVILDENDWLEIPIVEELFIDEEVTRIVWEKISEIIEESDCTLERFEDASVETHEDNDRIDAFYLFDGVHMGDPKKIIIKIEYKELATNIYLDIVDLETFQPNDEVKIDDDNLNGC